MILVEREERGDWPVSLPAGGLGDPPDSDQVNALDLPVFPVAGAVANDNAVATQEGEKEAVTVPERKKAEEARPFILAEALPVVPARIVKRILKGVFVDMAEFLRDNLELERRQAVIEGPPSAALPYRPSRREMPDLLSWIQCFSLFAGVVCSKYPDKAAQLWAYQATMWR